VVSDPVMRRTILAFVLPLVVLAGAACDEPQATPADSAPAVASPASATASPVVDAAPAPAPASTWDGSMPTRPVPKASPTVGAGMPAQVQMEAIAYMAAMGQPRFDDANADPDWAASFAERLRPVVRSLDKGSAEDKEKLDRVEIIGGGRKIDLLMAAGCDAETPSRAVVTRTSTPLSTLLAHGVLVVRCNDARAQCLQSTRDPTDVLCTTAPRHR
jgi:hypothetical protein